MKISNADGVEFTEPVTVADATAGKVYAAFTPQPVGGIRVTSSGA